MTPFAVRLSLMRTERRGGIHVLKQLFTKSANKMVRMVCFSKRFDTASDSYWFLASWTSWGECIIIMFLTVWFPVRFHKRSIKEFYVADLHSWIKILSGVIFYTYFAPKTILVPRFAHRVHAFSS